MVKKFKPEILEISEADMGDIVSRFTQNTLLDDDKKIILSVLSSYFWIVRQLKKTTFTMNRLRSFFGISTEKRGEKGENPGNNNQPSMPVQQGGTESNVPEPADIPNVKKI